MENKDWMTAKDKEIAEKWEAAKNYKPKGGTIGLGIWCLLCVVSIAYQMAGQGKSAGELWEAFIVAGLSWIGFFVLIAVLVRRHGVYVQMESLPEVKAYEKRKEAAEKEERRRQEAAFEARVSSLRRGHEKNELIVCASATFDGHYDRAGTRQVYVDGRPCGQASPWAVLGLPSGHHSVYVVYTESVGGRIYQGQTDAVSVCADEESVVLYTRKDGTSIYPSKVRGISSLGEVIKEAESDGAPAPNF